MNRTFVAFVSSIFILAVSHGVFAAEIINFGQVYRTGSASNGFPEFLNPTLSNVTTRAWNFNGSTQSLNGVSVLGTTPSGSSGLAISGSPSGYSGTFLNWAGDAQVAAKNNISNTGFVTTSPNSWSVNISAEANQWYQVEVLSNPVSGINQRSLDIFLDGSITPLADNLFVPTGPAWSSVYRFNVLADANGIDLRFGPGGDFDVNPYVTALSVTQLPEPASMITWALVGIIVSGIAVQIRRKSPLREL